MDVSVASAVRVPVHAAGPSHAADKTRTQAPTTTAVSYVTDAMITRLGGEGVVASRL